MKQGGLVARIVMGLFFAGVLIYLGVYARRALSDPFTTVAAYPYSMNDAETVTGLIVRREFVLPEKTGIVDVLPAEGEKLGVGQTVAMIYRDTAALDRKQERLTLQLEIEQLNYALRRRDNVGDLSQLDADIVQSMSTLRARTASGDLTGIEENTLALRSLVLKRTIPYDSTAESVAAIETMIADAAARLRALESAAAAESTAVYTDRSGIYSAMVDGFEDLLTPEALSGLTTGALESYLTLQPTPAEGSIGKLITDSRWYFAAPVPAETAARFEVGQLARVAFSRDFVGEVSMRVEQVSEAEDGMCAVVFSSTHHLGETTLLRRQTVELVFRQHSGLRVPKEAVRVREDGVQGVYVVVGAQAEFKPIEILREGETFFLVNGTGSERRVLRAGDELIITSEPLFDGKVVR